jgi:hypothetical protein
MLSAAVGSMHMHVGSLSSGGNAAGKHCRTAKLRSPVGYVTSAARTASTFISIAVMENHHSTTWRAEQGPTQQVVMLFNLAACHCN